MKWYIEAYENNRQVLGNLDGQGVIHAKDYRRTKQYKRLRQLPIAKLSLNGRINEYRIVNTGGRVVEVIYK